MLEGQRRCKLVYVCPRAEEDEALRTRPKALRPHKQDSKAVGNATNYRST